MTGDERQSAFEGLADEILRDNGRGRILVAVDGAEDVSRARFADALADGIRSRRKPAFRISVDGDAAEAMVRERLSTFRSGAFGEEAEAVPQDAILIVDGPALLRRGLRATWHFRVWLEGDGTLDEDTYQARLEYVRQDAPREAAGAIYDITDVTAPRRVFSDSC